MAEPTGPAREQRTEPVEPVPARAAEPAVAEGDRTADQTGRSARRGPDVLTLAAGLVTLAVAVMALTGWTPHLALVDLRWALAGGAVLLGLALLSASASGKARERRPAPRSSDDQPGADR